MTESAQDTDRSNLACAIELARRNAAPEQQEQLTRFIWAYYAGVSQAELEATDPEDLRISWRKCKII